MKLVVKNLSKSKLNLNSKFGNILPNQTKAFVLAVEDLERLSANLLALEAAGVLQWGVEENLSQDNRTEGATVSLCQVVGPLLDPRSGEFSRATEAFDDSTFEWRMPDVLRTIGGLALIESGPDRAVLSSRNLTGTGWVAGTGTVTAGYATGVDGTVSAASRVQVTSTQYGPLYSHAIGGLYYACGFYVQAVGPTAIIQGLLGSGAAPPGSETFASYVSESSWERIELVSNSGTVIPIDGRATAGLTARAIDSVVDLISFEVGPNVRYPTSSSRSSSRGADSWAWPAHQVPRVLREGRSKWVIRPRWSTSRLLSGDVRVLGSWGGYDDVLRVRHTGTDIRVEAVVGGIVCASSPALTWSGSCANPAPLLSIVVDPIEGTITVDEVTGTKGASWLWPTKPFRLGGVWGGAHEIDSLVSLPEAV